MTKARARILNEFNIESPVESGKSRKRLGGLVLMWVFQPAPDVLLFRGSYWKIILDQGIEAARGGWKSLQAVSCYRHAEPCP